jgi:hypothetical protein
MPWQDLPTYMTELKAAIVSGLQAAELEFQILTCVRPGEAQGALWEEFPPGNPFDWENAIWTIPGSRMKMKKVHRVPLSRQAVQLLLRIKEMRLNSPLAFPSKFGVAQIAPQTIAKLIPTDRYLSVNGLPGVLHGMRSSFRDWAADHEVLEVVAERCLAHILGSAVVQAYRRTEYLPQRREVLQNWADYLDTGDPSRAIIATVKPPKTREEQRRYMREYQRARRDKQYAEEGKQAKPWLRMVERCPPS